MMSELLLNSEWVFVCVQVYSCVSRSRMECNRIMTHLICIYYRQIEFLLRMSSVSVDAGQCVSQCVFVCIHMYKPQYVCVCVVLSSEGQVDESQTLGNHHSYTRAVSLVGSLCAVANTCQHQHSSPPDPLTHSSHPHLYLLPPIKHKLTPKALTASTQVFVHV